MRIPAVLVATLLAAACGNEAAPTEPTPSVAPRVTRAPTAPDVPPAPAVAPTVAQPVVTPFVRPDGFDLRATVAGGAGAVYVVARGAAPPPSAQDMTSADSVSHWEGRVDARTVSRTPSGEPVRILGPGFACDGTLGARVLLTARETNLGDAFHSVFAREVVGCRDSGWFAIVHPPPASRMPVPLSATDPTCQPAIIAAREAAARVGHLPSGPWLTPLVYRLGDATYALVAGPPCPEEQSLCSGATVGAVARVRAGQPAEVLIARTGAFVWEPAMGGFFEFIALTDVDGDGVVEMLEHMAAEQGQAWRLMRPGELQRGEIAWVLIGDAEVPFPQRVGPAPR